jgi:glycosyltransferase involved in cell wall biosynthesis
MRKMSLPKLLMVSPAAPFPLNMASKVRILNILKAASRKFDVTFLTVCDPRDMPENEKYLGSICSHTVLLPPRNRKNLAARVGHKGLSKLACFATGMPSEFYYSSILNLSSERVWNVLNGSSFDVVLLEYWFAAKSVEYFRKMGVPCVLDMHDILWRKRITSRNPNVSNILGTTYRNFLDKRYRMLEEATWQRFDHLIAINIAEGEYVKEKFDSNVSMITAGTGVDLNEWPYCWDPAVPPRIVFYGSLSGKENEIAALRCANQIMPLIWSKAPDAELWLIGANPTGSLRALQTNPRIKVTGFVDQVQDVLSSAAVMLCPLKGRYGFRSRLIEAMALGVPLSVTSDAVYGMGLEDGKGITVHDSDVDIANASVKLLQNPDLASAQSVLARKQVEEKFSFDATYGKIVSFLLACVKVGL